MFYIMVWPVGGARVLEYQIEAHLLSGAGAMKHNCCQKEKPTSFFTATDAAAVGVCLFVGAYKPTGKLLMLMSLCRPILAIC